MDRLIKELLSEESLDREPNLTANNEVEDIVKLFRKIVKYEKKQVMNGYLFGKEIIKQREEYYLLVKDRKTAAEQVNKEIFKGTIGYSYRYIVGESLRAIKVYEMLKEIGEERVSRIKTTGWSTISRLNKDEKQYVINGVKEKENNS